VHGIEVDEAQRAFALALWSLLGSVASKHGEAETRAAAARCCAAFRRACRSEPHYVLQVRGGALHGNGARIRPDVARFAATAGVIAMLQERAVSDVLLLASVALTDFVALARALVESKPGVDLAQRLLADGCDAIQVAQELAPAVELDVDRDEPCEPRPRAPSQLGAVFVMQRLASALGQRGPLAGLHARTILQNVLHRMQRLDAGLEPLLRLMRDPKGAGEAVNACVLATLTGEQLGWDDARGFDAGIAALLGPGLVFGIDEEALQLGQAAAAVAAMLGAAARPSEAIDRAEKQGAVSDAVGEAMEIVLATS
jgi:hypothetical protein